MKMTAKNLNKLLKDLDCLTDYLEYLMKERSRYINELIKVLRSVSDDILYYFSMICYFNKMIDICYPEWKELRRKIYYENDTKN